MDPTTPYSLYQHRQCNHQKHENPVHIKSIALQHINMHYQGFQQIYAGDSKEPNIGKVGAAIYGPSGPIEEGYRCTNNISLYSTEMTALIAAIKHIHNKGYQRTVVLWLPQCTTNTQKYHTNRSNLPNTVLILLHKSTIQPTHTIPEDFFICRQSKQQDCRQHCKTSTKSQQSHLQYTPISHRNIQHHLSQHTWHVKTPAKYKHNTYFQIKHKPQNP
jgi:hypothetical protein